jgi:hypothetical protein
MQLLQQNAVAVLVRLFNWTVPSLKAKKLSKLPREKYS